MKKNKMMRLASALLVLTLLTTGIIGGTLAKYTSAGSVSDTARVAKWGVAITTSGSLYSDAYANAKITDNGNLPAAWKNNAAVDGITVATAEAGKENIVAPGTKSYKDGLSFGISGKPEVAVTVKATIKAEDIFLKEGIYGVLVPVTVSDTESLKKVANENKEAEVYGFKTDAYTKVDKNSASYNIDTKYFILTNKVELTADYYPVVYTLKGNTTNEATGDSKTAVGIAEKLATAIKAGTNADTGEADYKKTFTNISADFKANTDLGTEGPEFEDENLTWEWKFEEGTGAELVANDAKDTILGDLIAARGASVDYKVVSIDSTSSDVTELTISNNDGDYTVKGTDNTVVANLHTQFDIDLSVTQID